MSALKLTSWLLVAAAVGAAAFLAPDQSLNIFVGLLLLVGAAMSSLGNHFLQGTPIPVRGGGVVTKSQNPIAYCAWFIAAATVFSFIACVLLHAVLASSAAQQVLQGPTSPPSAGSRP